MAKQPKHNPEGTKFNSWLIVPENRTITPAPGQPEKTITVNTIRRWVIFPDGRKAYERLPVKLYRQIRDDIAELQTYVDRLNYRNRKKDEALQRIRFQHAFISPSLLESYQQKLQTIVPSQRDALCEFSYLYNYCLTFFINTLKLNDPLDWKKNEHIWAQALLQQFSNKTEALRLKLRSSGKPHSPKTLRKIVNAANRFLSFLHEQYPDEIKPVKLTPISRAQFSSLRAKRELDETTPTRKYISEEQWAQIRASLPEDIKPFVYLAWHYGLRRSECLGIRPEDLKKSHLFVSRQLRKFPSFDGMEYGILKGKTCRKIPHYSCTPAETYIWIREIWKNPKAPMLMHPDTLTERWNGFMKTLGFEIDFHSIRHTTITRLVRAFTTNQSSVAAQKQSLRELQLCFGHRSIETTMGYLKDDRALEDELFVPDTITAA